MCRRRFEITIKVIEFRYKKRGESIIIEKMYFVK
jgi:hypothetical protein